MLIMFCIVVIILVVCCCCLKKTNRRARRRGAAPIIGYTARGQNLFMVPAGQEQPGGMMLVQGVPQVNNSPLINWSLFLGSHDSESGTLNH